MQVVTIDPITRLEGHGKISIFLDDVGEVTEARKRLREFIALLGGKVVHPVLGLPGGVAQAVKEEERAGIKQLAKDAVDFAEFSLQIFHDVVLKNADFVSLITGDIYRHETHYMGLVDANNKVNLYDGVVRVVDPEGNERLKFKPRDYAKHIAEHVEDWTYIKFPYLRDPGWKGFVDGKDSGVYRVAPLARANASDGMAAPKARAEYERMFDTLGGKPAHFTLANH